MIHRIVRRSFRDARAETIWLTIYSDLITNLMLLFLALYGISIMDSNAWEAAMKSMRSGDLRAFKQQHTEPLSKIADDVRNQVAFNPDIHVSEELDSIHIEFGDKILFQPARADISEQAIEPIRKICAVLKQVPYTIVIEGHTDSTPLGSGHPYKDNWELSLARSMEILRYFEAQGVPADKLATAAYGAYKPKASNLTRNGRRLNRRVEIALFRDFTTSGATHAAP